jgi:hypothetical protein
MSDHIPGDDGTRDVLPFSLNLSLDDAADDFFMPEVDRPDMAAPADVVRANNGLLREWLPVWLKNMGRMLGIYYSDLDSYPCGASQAVSPHLPEDLETCVVLGSGSTLTEALPALRSFKGTVICGPTNLGACWAHDVSPHFCILVDVGPFSARYLQKIAVPDAYLEEHGLHRPAFLIPTTCEPSAALAAPGKRFYFKHAIQGANGLNHPYNILTALLTPDLGEMMIQAGCVANAAVLLPSLFALNEKNPFAHIKRIFLVGVDYAHTHLGRVPAYRYENGALEAEPVPPAHQNASAVKITAANGVQSDYAMLAYKRSLLQLWERIFPAPGREKETGLYRLWTCSPKDRTSITEIPYAPLRYVLENRTHELREYTYDELMQQYSTYFTKTAGEEHQGLQTAEAAEKRDGPALLAPVHFSNMRRNVEEGIVLLKERYNTDTEENKKIMDTFCKNVDLALRAIPLYEGGDGKEDVVL